MRSTGWKTRELWCERALGSVVAAKSDAPYGLAVLQALDRLDQTIRSLRDPWFNRGAAVGNGRAAEDTVN